MIKIKKLMFARSQGIIDFTESKNKKNFRIFLGMISYDRMFVKNITELLKPLYLLCNKYKRFECNIDKKNAFDQIKVKIKEYFELRCLFLTKNFLEFDASDIRIGAFLL